MRLALPVAVVLAIVLAPTRAVRKADLGPGEPARSPSVAGNELLKRVPFTFVENLGQWPEGTRFLGRRGGGVAVHLERNAIVLQLLGRNAGPREESPLPGPRLAGRVEAREPRPVANARFLFEGSRDDVCLAGRDVTPTLYNFFLGNDPARWQMGVRGYGSVIYGGLYAGVDLLVREGGDSSLEYDLLLAPGGDLSAVAVRVEGADGALRLDNEGALVVSSPLGEIHQPRPKAWEERREGRRMEVGCSYRLLGADRFAFEAAGRTGDFALVVDPQLLFSTVLGGSAEDAAWALALDSTGAAVVAGRTGSPNFPTQNAFQSTWGGAFPTFDAFVTRLPLSGGPPSYSTYLGGDSYDEASALAVDSTGAAVVAGYTASPNFPTQNAFQSTLSGNLDAFITRLPLSGGPPSYSTYLGGSGGESAASLVLDSTGAAVLAGSTNLPNFPTQNALQPTYGGGASDVTVTRLSLSGGPPSYSTYLGGNSDDVAYALTLDSTGAAVVAGLTASTNFPTQSAFQPTYGGGNWDAFVTRLPLSGGPPSYSTFLGGSAGDYARALALDSTGAGVVAGLTASTNFPTQSAFQPTSGGNYDAFVTRLPLSGGPPSYSTYLGGSLDDQAHALALDSTGAAVVAGWALSANFPNQNAIQPAYAGGFSSDAFVTRLPLSGGPPTFSTYLGGNSGDAVYALALDSTGAAVVAGQTSSSNFPTQNAFQPTSGVWGDAFVSNIDMLPTGLSAYGASSPGCAGPLAIGANSIPQVGNAAFVVTCGNAPPSAVGYLAFSDAPLASPLVIIGVQIWIDPASPQFFLLPVNSNTAGVAQVPIPVPGIPSLAGAQVYTQFAWAGPSAPSPPCPPIGISASNALAIVVQP
ncbi:MAG: hypothetical protein L0323_00650 [Planctomycetes bacterium]|nr:hypothetical protein [Planctomycetota bacterium]